MSVERMAIRLVAMAGTILAVSACTTPVKPPPSQIGAVIDTRPIDVMGKLTVHRGDATAEPLEGVVAERTIAGPGIEYIVKLDSGPVVSVAQELTAEGRQLAVGQRVVIQEHDSEKLVVSAPAI